MPDDVEMSWLAIADGTVIEVANDADPRSVLGFLCECADNSEVTELVRMPHAAVSLFYRQPWPGREAALALIAQQEDRPHG